MELRAKRLSTLRRVQALPWTQKTILVEAAVAVALARILTLRSDLRRLSVAPFWLRPWPIASAASDSRGAVEGLRWAVDVVAPRLRAACLPKSLALHWLLARRGFGSRVCLGVRAAGTPFAAHAWVEVEGRSDATGEGYVRLCELPRA